MSSNCDVRQDAVSGRLIARRLHTGRVAVASSGVGTTLNYSASWNSGLPNSFIADVTDLTTGATVATSNEVTVSAAPWSITLSPATSTVATGTTTSITATAN